MTIIVIFILSRMAMPIYILLLLNIVDYATGIMAASYRNMPITSYLSFNGIIKKVSMLLLIFVGYVVDWLIVFSSFLNLFDGVNFFVSTTICVWLIFNEIISVLENISDIGIKIPKFLMKILESFKSMDE